MSGDIKNINISNSSILRIILFVVLMVVLFLLRNLILIVLTAIVISSFLEGPIKRLSHIKINRILSTIAIYLFTIGIFSLIFSVFAPGLIKEFSTIIASLAEYLPSSGFLQTFGGDGVLSGVKDVIVGLTKNISLPESIMGITNFVSGLSGGFIQTLSIIFGGVVNVVLIFVLSFYFSIQEKGIDNFLKIITPIRHEKYIINLWQRVQKKIGLWFQGQLIDALIVGVLTFLGLTIFRVEYALFLSIITVFLTIIPFGVIFATVVAIIFAYLDGGITLALTVAGLYLIIQQFENYLLQPLIIRKVTGLSPLVVILSLLIGAQLAGFWGLILAIPVAVLILEITNNAENEKFSKE